MKEVQELVGIVPWTFVAQICNLFLTVFLVKKFLFDRINKVVEERKQMVEKELDEAAVSSRDADLLKKKYELSLENAKAEADDIVTKAKVRASEEYDRILKKADADAAKKADEAKKVIELEREKALNDLQASVTGLAMTAAAKLLSEQRSPENDRKRYQAFLASAGEKHD